MIVEHTGSLEECLAWIKEYFVEYPPQGYGTSVRTIYFDQFKEYVCRIIRMESCD